MSEQLPRDPMILLSVINTKLRDYYQNLDLLCEDLQISKEYLEAKLDEAFVRVGRSYLVNLNYVRRIGKTELILNTGEKLPVPRGSYKKLNEAFIKYF